jgi:hypothetical protein
LIGRRKRELIFHRARPGGFHFYFDLKPLLNSKREFLTIAPAIGIGESMIEMTPARREHLRRIASLGGSVRSEKKAAAARRNCAKAGRSRSDAKVIAARANGKCGGRPVRLKTVAEVVAEEGAKFKKLHPDLFPA